MTTVIVDRESLEAAVKDTLQRPDLADRVPGWVRLGESDVLREVSAGRGFENNPIYRTPIYPIGPEPEAQNWLLVEHPTLYLYAALKHAMPWLREDERMVGLHQLYADALDNIATESRRLPPEIPPQIGHDQRVAVSPRSNLYLAPEGDNADDA